ncbi:MAG: hypothetical protein EXS09_09475 [Gemmataceae bacterium]|nr:hypothetical protein [Gemmataceae bacterium]
MNQFRKGGALNFIFFVFIAVCSVISAIGLAITGFFFGWLALPEADEQVRLFVWDGIVAAIMFFWMIGLLADLQRSESLSLDKFLHLPVSLSGAFLINYFSSFFSVTLMVFVPGMVGLILGQSIAHGPRTLLALPLLLAAVFALTAVTYHFQCWLATLMANPRRKSTVVILVTAGFIFMAQLPQLVNIMRPHKFDHATSMLEIEEHAQLTNQLVSQKISQPEYQKQQADLQKRQQERRDATTKSSLENAGATARFLSALFPPGWLALGSADLTEGRVLWALVGTLGLSLIGSASLNRAYRTTIRLYTGHYNSKERKVVSPLAVKAPLSNKPRLLEWQLPRVSEQVSAVAVAAFRSLTRAPEAKMALLAPIVMAIAFGGIILSTDESPPRAMRPIIVFGVSSMILLISGVQLIGNQFGYDRTGFRAYVLSPIPRKDILIGKNLAAAPLTVGLGLMGIALVGGFFPMRIDHYPTAIAQLLASYLFFCLLVNVLSMFAPMAMAAGSIKASNVKFGPVMLQLVFLMFIPLALPPAALPIGIEALLEQTDVVSGVPISLPLSLVVLALALLLYRAMIRVEEEWLLLREKKILEVVTSKTD